MTNTIYLVRHAENTANLTKEFSHRLVDYSLTPKGILQAQQTAEYFTDKNIDEIYSSPLKRARETADIIAQKLHLPVGVVEQFREVNVGSLEGRPPTPKIGRCMNALCKPGRKVDTMQPFPTAKTIQCSWQECAQGYAKSAPIRATRTLLSLRMVALSLAQSPTSVPM